MSAKPQAGRRGGRARPEDELALGTDKLYFKIGEVAEIVGVAAHVLRYWESEFPVLQPSKSRTQQRVYRRRDVATLLRIKHLLYVEQFTIAGARKQLRRGIAAGPLAPPSPAYVARQSLAPVYAVLDELDALLASPAGLDPTGADPAAYLSEVGAAKAAAEDPAEPAGVLERPDRAPRGPTRPLGPR